MYLPQQFEETRLDVLHQLIRSHPFGTFVIHGDAELIANHMPFLIDSREGPCGTLRAHVARSNPVWKQFGKPVEALVVFQGPDSYITPSWYPSKHADGKAVPTWNYAVVHAYGQPRAIDDPAWLLAHVTPLTAEHEASQALPWKVSDAPEGYRDQMISRSESGPDCASRRSRRRWRSLGPHGPLSRFAVQRGAALKPHNGRPL
jgi:transcriptional regulator